MPAPVQTLQVASPALGTVSRMPQTTAAPGGGGTIPFARLSRRGQIQGPQQAGNLFGALWTPILKPVGGYLSALILYVDAVNGAGTGATGTADAPYNVIQNLFLRDPFGQPIIQAGGFSLNLINIYSGQVGMLSFGNNPGTLPSFSAIAGTGGNFSFRVVLPLELDSSGYCSLPSMNAASQPQLQVQLNPSATVFATPPITTVPTITLTCDEPFWMAPVDAPQVAPPDVGSSAQWSEAQAAQGVGANAWQRIQLPRVGTFIHTLILVLRDSTGARVDLWPTGDLGLWFDGVPIRYESLRERSDAMWTQFGVTRPTGVIVYTFRDSVQTAISNADTYDLLAPTTPATLLEVSGTFGNLTNSPGKITAITGELYPVGGIPYTHLAN